MVLNIPVSCSQRDQPPLHCAKRRGREAETDVWAPAGLQRIITVAEESQHAVFMKLTADLTCRCEAKRQKDVYECHLHSLKRPVFAIKG